MKKINLLITSLFIGIAATAATPKDVTIYINPGHGGHDSNDRNVVISPFVQGDPNGFWESNSNLDKGLMLKDMLEAKGCKVHMSRVTNTSDDDLGLTTIGRLANATNADMFFSIHSNATGTANRVNYTLMLFRGFTETPENPEGKVIAKMLGDHIITNQATVWTTKSPAIYGDFSFGGFGSGELGGLGVLRVLTIPGMLSEGSFHDYIPETYRLMNMEFKWHEAWQFLKTVNQYMGLEGQTTGHVAGCIYDSRVKRNVDYIMHERDVQESINMATVQLLDVNGSVKQEYTTDELFNGFYAFKNVEPGDYKVKVIKDTHYTTETNVKVTADLVSYANIPMNKVRSTAPEVLSYSPVWKDGDAPMLCNTPISFTFNWDMDIESTELAFEISPAIKGTFEWKDSNYQMSFVPSEPYKANTEYTVILHKTAEHGGGTTMTNDVKFSFTTDARRFLTITAISPAEGEEMHYKGAGICVQTDVALNAARIMKVVTLTNSKGDNVVMNNRALSYNKSADSYGWFKYAIASALTVGEEYTLTISGAMDDRNGIKIDGDKVVKFTATDVGTEKVGAGVVNTFENPVLFVYDKESSVGCSTASTTKDTSGKLFGAACGNFKYTFSSEKGGVAQFTLSMPSDIVVTLKDKIGIHVNGDMSGNALYAVMTDGLETKDVKLCDVKFYGWKYVTANPDALLDGKDYKLTGIKIVQSDSKPSITGAIKLDDMLVFAGQSGIEDAEVSSLTIYPNPANEYIIANADTLIESLELISMNGSVVSKIDGNIMNVSEIAEGNYIVMIKVASGNITKKITIVH